MNARGQEVQALLAVFRQPSEIPVLLLESWRLQRVAAGYIGEIRMALEECALPPNLAALLQKAFSALGRARKLAGVATNAAEIASGPQADSYGRFLRETQVLVEELADIGGVELAGHRVAAAEPVALGADDECVARLKKAFEFDTELADRKMMAWRMVSASWRLLDGVRGELEDGARPAKLAFDLNEAWAANEIARTFANLEEPFFQTLRSETRRRVEALAASGGAALSR
ncbi:MAG: hypothetical protein AAF411_10085 [Myxococcota bacterium]